MRHQNFSMMITGATACPSRRPAAHQAHWWEAHLRRTRTSRMGPPARRVTSSGGSGQMDGDERGGRCEQHGHSAKHSQNSHPLARSVCSDGARHGTSHDRECLLAGRMRMAWRTIGERGKDWTGRRVH
ncbi:hypothetical protein C8Q76DRAFT_319896 [Earliella scabrosa]|nr:hypothetical protein C8Q76DRAFT_319896 [Earliella scabrosa]